jgi:hypothetical protein
MKSMLRSILEQTIGNILGNEITQLLNYLWREFSSNRDEHGKTVAETFLNLNIAE